MLEFLSNLWNMLWRGSNLQYEWLKAVCLFWEFTFVTLTSSLLKCHLYIYSIHVVEEAAKAEVATWVLSYLWVNAVSKGRQQKPSSPGHTQGQANYKCAGLETKRWDMWALASSYTCICVFIPQCIPRRPLIKGTAEKCPFQPSLFAPFIWIQQTEENKTKSQKYFIKSSSII